MAAQSYYTGYVNGETPATLSYVAISKERFSLGQLIGDREKGREKKFSKDEELSDLISFTWPFTHEWSYSCQRFPAVPHLSKFIKQYNERILIMLVGSPNTKLIHWNG